MQAYKGMTYASLAGKPDISAGVLPKPGALPQVAITSQDALAKLVASVSALHSAAGPPILLH